MADGWSLLSWLGDLGEGAEEARERIGNNLEDLGESICNGLQEAGEAISNEVQEVGETLSDGFETIYNNITNEFNEAVDAFNSQRALLQDLEAKRDALVEFQNFLNQYESIVGILHSDFEMIETLFDRSSGLLRTEISESLIELGDPTHLRTIGLAHDNSHDNLQSLVAADLSALRNRICEELFSLNWLSDNVQQVVVLASGYGIYLYWPQD